MNVDPAADIPPRAAPDGAGAPVAGDRRGDRRGGRRFYRLAAIAALAGVLLLALLAYVLNLSARTGQPSAGLGARIRAMTDPWEWAAPGFAGGAPITLTQGITHHVYYAWSPQCDSPDRHRVPMIWGKDDFYRDVKELRALFDGGCNDGRPLLFLNEPAKEEQANISPAEAAEMFYTMTRGADWPYARWRGPIYAGNNLVEERAWDAEFVRQFSERYNSGSTAIPEIAGWGVHLYGNYQYGPGAGDPNTVWIEDVPAAEIERVVDRSMAELDRYLAERAAEGNATSVAVTEFGLLQASAWHDPPAFFYDTTAGFMYRYVQRFDLVPQVQAWFWFISAGSADEFLDANLMVDPRTGGLTPNGEMWRVLAAERQLPSR